MMKIKLFILSIIGVFALTGCEDFLDEQPVSSLSEANFYTDASDLRYAIDGAYSLTRTAYFNEFLVTEQRTENATLMNFEGEWAQLENGTESADNTLVQSFWDGQYSVINSANLVLENSDIATVAEGKLLMEAEALFLRALMHFNLARTFEEFYYMENSVTWNEALDLTTTTASVIYPKMIADLQTAIPNLPSQNSADQGRVTKGAAQILLADIYLTIDNKSEAKAILETLIADAEANGTYVLEGSFADIFTNELSDEIIFQIGYVQGSEDLGQEFSQEFTTGGYGTGINIPTENLIAAWGATTDNYLTYGSDTRLKVAVDTNATSQQRMNGKYGEDVEYSGKDWIVYRYADALLMYVEATITGASTTDANALLYYNAIINRADASATPVTSVSDSDLLLQRRLEFAGENKYLYDLRRLGSGAPGLLAIPNRELRIRI